MKEAIKHEYAEIGDELLSSVFCKRKICFLQSIFFFTLGRNEYFKPLLEISGCPDKAAAVQKDWNDKRTQAFPSSASCFSEAALDGQNHYSIPCVFNHIVKMLV